MNNFKKPLGIAAQLHAYQAMRERAAAPVNGVEPHPSTTDFFQNLMKVWKNKYTEKQLEKQLEEISL